MTRHKVLVLVLIFVLVLARLAIGGVAMQNANHFGVIVNHFGKVNRNTANHF